MPELPEVETVRRGLEASIIGKRIARLVLQRKDLRIPFPHGLSSQLKGKKILAVARRAKYLLLHMEDAPTLMAHLGMTGRFSVLHTMPQKYAAHDHVVFYFGGY